MSSCGTPFKPERIPQGKNIKFVVDASHVYVGAWALGCIQVAY